MADFVEKLCMVERDRVTAAEICIDEILTIMDRHDVRGSFYEILRDVSAELDDMLLNADGHFNRRKRLMRVRKTLTDAFPMTDEDLKETP